MEEGPRPGADKCVTAPVATGYTTERLGGNDIAKQPVVKAAAPRAHKKEAAAPLPLPLPPPPTVVLPQPQAPPPPPGLVEERVGDSNPLRHREQTSRMLIDGEDVLQSVMDRVGMGDRADFVRLTAEWLQHGPDSQALRAYANAYPDRWMQGLTMAGRMAGLADKKEVHNSTTLYAFVKEIEGMSDAELFRRARQPVTGTELSRAALPPQRPT